MHCDLTMGRQRVENCLAQQLVAECQLGAVGQLQPGFDTRVDTVRGAGCDPLDKPRVDPRAPKLCEQCAKDPLDRGCHV